ncbi:MAG: hypothetical protein KA998_01365 [Rickettsiaceae bacterium]|nr:hypothetical protein [Rickettsiaceae bacterium]
MKEFINYPKLVEEAMRNIVFKVLQKISKEGPCGDHHFYISFATQILGVKIPARFKEQYKDEMTIVLQHQYEDLVVDNDKFSVKLRFGGIPELIVVPLRAVTKFSDPSVDFGIEFTSYDPIHITEGSEEIEERVIEEKDIDNVIRLDAFRKKTEK